MIRLYSISFSDFIVEAKVDSTICSLSISNDNQRIVGGSNDGEIGIVFLIDKLYQPILRKLTESLAQVYVHPNGKYIFTISNEIVISIWKTAIKREEYNTLQNQKETRE